MSWDVVPDSRLWVLPSTQGMREIMEHNISTGIWFEDRRDEIAFYSEMYEQVRILYHAHFHAAKDDYDYFVKYYRGDSILTHFTRSREERGADPPDMDDFVENATYHIQRKVFGYPDHLARAHRTKFMSKQWYDDHVVRAGLHNMLPRAYTMRGRARANAQQDQAQKRRAELISHIQHITLVETKRRRSVTSHASSGSPQDQPVTMPPPPPPPVYPLEQRDIRYGGHGDSRGGQSQGDRSRTPTGTQWRPRGGGWQQQNSGWGNWRPTTTSTSSASTSQTDQQNWQENEWIGWRSSGWRDWSGSQWSGNR